MRVVLDNRYRAERYPGIARYVEVLREGLSELAGGPEVTLVDSLPLRARPATRSWAEQWRLPAAVRRSAFDLWHAPYLVFPYAVPLPVVATVFDLIGTRPGTGTNRRAVGLAVRLALRRARLVVTASEATAAEIGRAFPAFAGKLRVVPGAAARRFRPPPADVIRAVTSRLGLPPRYLLYVGTDRPHKNLAGLVSGFGRYRRTADGDVVLAMAGPTADRRPPAAVRFLGRVSDDDLAALYAGARLFVSASTEEGFGLPVLEAMACGTGVVCSDAPALAELTGDAAVRFPATDTQAMAVAIAEGLARRDELARRGLARAAGYSPARTAALTVELYEEALGRAPSRKRYHP